MKSERSRRTGLTLLAAYALMAAAWLVSNPPFAAPDEFSHYLRAAALSDGQLLGEQARIPGHYESEEQRSWVEATTREVRIPAGRFPSGFDCMTYEPDRSASCLDDARADPSRTSAITPVGTYPPTPYLVPALTLRLDESPPGSLRLGRLGMAVVWLLLCWIALRFAWVGPGFAAPLFAAIALVVTPTVVFLGATLNGSAIEVMASIAFLLALLQVARAPAPTTADWVAGAFSGALLATARASGPVWVLLDLLAVLALVGVGSLRDPRWRRPAAAFAGGAVAVGVLFALAWQAAVGPDAPVTPIPSPATLGDGFTHTFASLREAVGSFDYLEFRLPLAIAVPWLLLAAGLVATALWASEGRERIALAAISAAAIVLPPYLYAAAISHTGFGLQGRTMLPVFIPAVLLAGDVLRRRTPAALEPRIAQAAASLIGLAAILQVAAWWVNSRRFAVGLDGPLLFFRDADWDPPLGWAPWLALMVVGAALMATAGMLLARSSR